ncbi:MAG: FecR domain-containing protein, partial [Candidatus Aminicenantes bacterium]|nr:FecR domain-containing protein [Candidatus Aminicenantes bacterium]
MKKSTGFFFCIVFLFSPLTAEDIPYTNGSVARLSCVEGEVFLQRAADMSFEKAVLNMPVTEGDRLGTTDGRAELYISRGKYIRLNHNTKIDILKLPDNSSDLVQIRVWAGSCYLRINHLDQDKGFELHTPDLSAYVLDRGLFRFDIRENQETELFVFQGLLEAALEDGSVMIKADQRLEAIDGRAISDPSKFLSTTEDSFDRWNKQRDYDLGRESDSRYLPEELTDFETELADSGRWDDVAPYGQVWIPFGADMEWRPYYNGRWVWLGLTGWTW